MPGSFDLLAVFNTLPGPYLLLSPTLRIEAVNDAYLAATLTTREHLLAQYMFDAFPDNPATPEAQGVANLNASLQQVLATGQPHKMAVQHYDVPDIATPGAFVVRYWEPINTPVLDAHGAVTGIIHHVVNITDRVQADVHLRDSQAREQQALAQAQAERATLRHTLEQAPVAIAILEGADHVVTFANEGMHLLWGRPIASLLGWPHFEALPDLAGQGFETIFANAYQHGQPYYLHEQPVQIDRVGTGQLIPGYFNIVYQPLRDGQNRITGIVASATEVTEQVLARQRVQDLNEELITQGYPELLAQVWRTGEPMTKQESPARFVRHQPGGIGYFTFAYQPIFAAAGHITDIMCVAVDVTAQVRARQAAEASARQLRLITDALPVLIAYLDRDQRYQFANKAYKPWFNLEPAELLGRHIREVAGEQAYPNIQPYILRALAGEPVEFEAEMPFRPDFTRHIRTNYLPDVQQGEVQGFYTLATDVTEQVLARRQVQDLNEELAAINEELTATNEELHESNTHLGRTNTDLGTFVYTASHDLKAPITNIEGLIAALRETLPAAVQQDDVIAHLLSLLDDTVHRFQTTITQLTDLSRLQNAYEEPAAALALAPVVAGVLADLAPAIVEAQAAVQVRVPAELQVSFAPASLRSVVYNLLSNAVKYRDPQRMATVEVQAERQPGGVVLTVRDNGLGLNALQQQRLFGLFQRLHTHVEGTGVGLYMIKRLLENAGATIAVTSLPAAGTTFTVTFPA